VKNLENLPLLDLLIPHQWFLISKKMRLFAASLNKSMEG